jgi:TolA-binding protein
MKVLTLSLLLSGLASVASAQMKDRVAAVPGNARGPEPTAAEITRQMANRLHLNEAQYIRLRSVNQLKLARMDEIQWQYQQDPALRQQKLQELDAQYEQECQRILTPSQISLMRDELRREAVPTPQDPTGNGLG